MRFPKLFHHFVSVCGLLPLTLSAQEPEFRGFWADAFHSGFTNSAQVTQMIADTRAANCNALIVQVRKGVS